MEFCIMPDDSMGKLVSSPFQAELKTDRRIEVPVHALDELLAAGHIEMPDVVKVDVEGAEALVLRGAARILRERKTKWFIEIHSRSLARECASLLSANGLRCGCPGDRPSARFC